LTQSLIVRFSSRYDNQMHGGAAIREEPQFDIFSGSPTEDVLWIEAVPGLESARQRMQEVASRVPGKYFLFSASSQTILAQVDTIGDTGNPPGQTRRGAA